MKNLHRIIVRTVISLLMIVAIVAGGSHDDGHPHEPTKKVMIIKCKKKDDKEGE